MYNETIEEYNASDYTLDELDLPTARKNFWDNKHQYNQEFSAKNGCVFYAGWWCIQDNYEDSMDNKKHLDALKKKAPDYWRDKDRGMYLYKGVDLVRDYWNDISNEEVVTLRVGLGSTAFYEALEKGYSVHTGYQWDSEYNQDFKEDGDIDGTDFDANYWHSIRITTRNTDEYVVDNYQGREYNIYKLEDLEGLIENDVYFNSGYIYIFKKDLKQMDQYQKDINDIKMALDKWITNDTTLLDKVKNGNYTQTVKSLLFVIRANRKL